MDDNECPNCGSDQLDDGTFAFNGVDGTQDYTPHPLHFECMECTWSGDEPNGVGDHQAMLDDKADGEHEERMLERYQDDC